MNYTIDGLVPWWLGWLLHIIGLAAGVWVGSRWLRRDASGETRTYYVVCPRCGRRRHGRYGVGGGRKTEEAQ